MLVDICLYIPVIIPDVPVSAVITLKLISPSPDFFCVWRCQRRSLRFKIFVNACYDNNYCIFFLKTVSDNFRWIHKMSDLFIKKILVEMLVEFCLFTKTLAPASVWECFMNSFQLTPSPYDSKFFYFADKQLFCTLEESALCVNFRFLNI